MVFEENSNQKQQLQISVLQEVERELASLSNSHFSMIFTWILEILEVRIQEAETAWLRKKQIRGDGGVRVSHFLLAIVRQIIEVQSLLSVFITFTAWSLSEVIRYSHYALSTLKICPSWLTYFRYTAFIFLYPIGVGPGEMWLMYQALPYIKKRNLYSDFFNKFGISYYSFVVAVLVCYPLLWLKLYLHLFKQRRSKLKKKERKKKLKK
ncbi:hypothetical protein LUZ61_006992 [Rhynchospora tenuis]|uniref:Very-long-chain (3R)-3-hydroxyacyl-CoA dehydratase n=1 Tax=Rhynchospora tenuis TaxID=198213 RepID=A0AAD6EW08_9POAL|nr:hypothetical protein LUZ61_006992 [Rhynchospora tenuis]